MLYEKRNINPEEYFLPNEQLILILTSQVTFSIHQYVLSQTDVTCACKSILVYSLPSAVLHPPSKKFPSSFLPHDFIFGSNNTGNMLIWEYFAWLLMLKYPFYVGKVTLTLRDFTEKKLTDITSCCKSILFYIWLPIIFIVPIYSMQFNRTILAETHSSLWHHFLCQ